MITRLIALGSLAFMSACQSIADGGEADWLSGRVVDLEGAPVQAEITIGDEQFSTDPQGYFSIAPRTASTYRFEIDAEGFYSMRHTFSHDELAGDPVLNDIALVMEKPGRTLFVFGGDAMIGRRFYDPFEGEPALVSQESVLEDSKALLAEMKPYLDVADYASINLETPIFETPPSAPVPKSVTFYSAPETLKALEWAGIDYVALGNNHVYDFLEPGLDVTMAYLRDSQLDFSGAGKNEAEALQPYRLQRGSDFFDFLSYVGWPAGPPTQSAETDKGGAALGTSENIVSSTKASTQNAGIPVLQFHGGLEYVEEPTLAIETRLKQAVDAGAALVIGHHPHVAQGLELYEGKLIAWSLGNFLFDQYFYSAQSAALLYVWMDGDEFHHAEAVPIYIKGYHPTPAVGPMRNAINRRLTNLSAKRDTHLIRSGGHMILPAVKNPNAAKPVFDVVTDCQAELGRTGHDLLARGDFEAHNLFDAPDRSWLDLDSRVSIKPSNDEPDNMVMQIDLDAGETVLTGMRKFQRVFTPGTPMSVRADLSANAATDIDVFLQIRATGQSLQEGLTIGKKIWLGSKSLKAGETAKLDLDFDSPRTRARSVRVLIQVSAGQAPSALILDNLEFIEWRTTLHSDVPSCGD